ncbi:MAG: agmatine deiminase family protein [Cyclobacteriaceae bacterium]|nr:agmatine deiminase family protein [Cyclobacteriaceae bacterium]
MKNLILLFPLLLLSCSEKKSESKAYSYPPEWYPHQAVWIDFHDDKYWPVPDTRARFEIIESLYKKVPVNVLVDGNVAAIKLDSLIEANGLDRESITVVRHEQPNIAMRDAGPIFLTNGDSLMIADFRWSGYAGKHADDLERGAIDNDLAKRYGWKINSSEFAAEGGGLEVNENVILSFKHHGLSRNPGKSLEEIEAAYLKMYNKEKMIWIEESMLLETPGRKIDNYFGQGADQHIDAYFRFVNDSTILTPVIADSEKNNSPIQEHDYMAIQKNLAQLRKETNADGKPFTIVEIPMPDISLYTYKMPAQEYMLDGYPEMVVGEEVVLVPVMGYSNFLITNGAVLVSEYWREGLPLKEKEKDEEMKEILSKYFPDREIIGIKNALLLNWNGGGIHCQTQQQPKLN